MQAVAGKKPSNASGSDEGEDEVDDDDEDNDDDNVDEIDVAPSDAEEDENYDDDVSDGFVQRQKPGTISGTSVTLTHQLLT